MTTRTGIKSKINAGCFYLSISIFFSGYCINASLAQSTPALRGPGEPASPENLAHPELSTPNHNRSLSPRTSDPEAQDTSKNIPLRPAPSGDFSSPVTLKNSIEQTVITKPFTLTSAVTYAERNYPSILRSIAESNAAQKNISVQKLNEYLPDSLLQYQEIMSSHNKISQVFFGSPVFPAVAGPGLPNNVTMKPIFYSGAGASLDWAPLDFGLHKARINLSKSQYGQATAQLAVTRFDVSVAASSAFLDVVESLEQVRAAEENVASFSQFRTVVNAQVKAYLKPGADASLAEAQLANASNQLLRARLAKEIALANLANAIGAGGSEVSIDPTGLATDTQATQTQQTKPIFEEVPVLKSSRASIVAAIAQRKVLDKENFPVFHLLGGFSTRGSGLGLDGKHDQSLGGNGVFPVIPNYQLAVIVNWNFLDYFRTKAQKKVQDQRINAQQQEYNLVMQNLRTEDVKSRARVKTAVQIAANMPIQVHAAEHAVQQAEARYKTGLGSVAQVAEANQVLAQSRMQEAIARVGIWRALLAVASVHGDLKPFLAEANRIQSKGM